MVALVWVWKLETVLAEVLSGLSGDPTSAIDQLQGQFWDAQEREMGSWDIRVRRLCSNDDRSDCPSRQVRLQRRRRSRPSSGAAETG